MLRRRLLRETRGAAAAELALMLPLLVMLLIGAFEGGYFLWNEHKATKGVRDGARYAARNSFSKFTCPSTIDSTLETGIKNITRTGTPDGTANPVIVGWDDSEVTVTLDCDGTMTTGIYASMSDGAPLVTVSASVPYPSLFGMIGFDTASIHLNARAQAAVMGL